MKAAKTRQPPSDAARKMMSDAKLVHYDGEATTRIEATRSVMKIIQEEMASNGGVYPFNKGVVSAAEVARRSGYHPATLHKDRYEELRDELQTWISNLKKSGFVGKARVRKALAQRVDEWKKLYQDLAEVHRVSETDLMRAEARVEELEHKIAELNEQLRRRKEDRVMTLRQVQENE